MEFVNYLGGNVAYAAPTEGVANEAANTEEHASSEETAPLFYIGPMPVTSITTTTWGVILLLVLISAIVTRKMTKVPGKLQAAVEMVVSGLNNFFGDILGEKKAKAFMPLLGTLFIFILTCNLCGLLPLCGHLPGLAAPTSSLSVTVALAVVVFFTTHAAGFKYNGVGYLGHFVKPMAFLLPLLIIEEFVRPLSLSLRLFGNIFGEETVGRQIFELCPLIAPLPLYILSLLFCLVQALVFTMLTSIYIDGSTSHEH